MVYVSQIEDHNYDKVNYVELKRLVQNRGDVRIVSVQSENLWHKKLHGTTSSFE